MADRVPFVALDRQHAELRGELQAAFERVIHSSAFILGGEVAKFEAEFAAYCGVRHCVGVASGTAALALAMQAAGIGEGDEVIVPAHTFIASALAVLQTGATPAFCDVEDGSGLLDLESARATVSSRTAAILPVHLYGQICDMEAICSFAKQQGLAVFEDAAQAHGAALGSRLAGSFGIAGSFSFYPSKNLGALGDAGAICTNDDELADRARILRDLGQRRKGEHVVAGVNERLDGLQAALLSVKLPHLDEWNAARRNHAHSYRGLLGDSVRMLEEPEGRSSVYHVFPVRVPDRDALRSQLSEAEIETGIHYSPALHRQPPFRESRSRSFPVADSWASEELSLPMFAELRADEIQRIAAAFNAILGRS
jgi:dTDP-4-amino-4,6-dideoxygalactose transaminase